MRWLQRRLQCTLPDHEAVASQGWHLLPAPTPTAYHCAGSRSFVTPSLPSNAVGRVIAWLVLPPKVVFGPLQPASAYRGATLTAKDKDSAPPSKQ